MNWNVLQAELRTGGSRPIRTRLIHKSHGACVPVFAVLNLMLNLKLGSNMDSSDLETTVFVGRNLLQD